MPRRKDNWVEDFIQAPWWVSVIMACVAFGFFALLSAFIPTLGMLAPLAFLFFLMFAGLSFIFSLKKASLVEKQTNIASLQGMSWGQFEWMVGEAYRRMGYAVDETLFKGPDGGIDLVIRKPGYRGIVQCKRWKTWSVGAPVVRELYGLLVDQNADEAIVVTSGKFTRDAIRFAEGKPVRLVDGSALLKLLSGVQRNRVEVTRTDYPDEPLPDCPKCGALMVLRTAKRGPSPGKSFYGCSRYPKCKGTLPIGG